MASTRVTKGLAKTGTRSQVVASITIPPPSSKQNAKPSPSDVRYFSTPDALGAWFEKHHQEATEVWVGFYKRGTGKPSVTWPESVDEALRVGWIDGLRKSLDEERYVIRFTPRKKGSIWSQVNLQKIAELQKQGRMLPAGEKVFAERDQKNVNRYSFEQKEKGFDAAIEERLRQTSAKAWAYFSERPPWYRRTSAYFVSSAKRDETRERRFLSLVDACERGVFIDQLVSPKGATAKTESSGRKKTSPEKQKSPASKPASKKAREKRPAKKKASRSRGG